MAAIAAIVVLTALLVPGKSSPPGPVTIPIGSGGPSTSALVHGVWKAIPTAPVKVCNPTVVPTGSGAIVLDTGVNQACAPAAAVFDATTDAWTKIAAPPATRDQPLATWGNGELVIVEPDSGEGWQWMPVSNRWTQTVGVHILTNPFSIKTGPLALPKIPPVVTSLAWDGDSLLAAEVVHGRTHILNVSSPLGSPRVPPPAPASAQVQNASITTINGDLVLAEEVERGSSAEHVEIYRLDSTDQWTQLASSLGRALRGLRTYGSPTTLTTVANRLLVVGDECPGGCYEDAQEAALVRIGSTAAATTSARLNLRTGLETTALVSAGQGSVVALYPRGRSRAGYLSYGRYAANGSNAVPRSTTSIFDVVDGKARSGPSLPTRPSSRYSVSSVWTSSGVLDLALAGESGTPAAHTLGGWILTPRG